VRGCRPFRSTGDDEVMLVLNIADEIFERQLARVCGASSDGLNGLEPKG
jgi:hypothetical protein